MVCLIQWKERLKKLLSKTYTGDKGCNVSERIERGLKRLDRGDAKRNSVV